MKNIYLLLMFTVFLSTSCQKDLLEKYPLDQITDKDFFKTANDLKLYVNQFYTSFPGYSNWDMGIYGIDANSDNTVPGSFNAILGGTTTVPATGGGWSWVNIREINYLLSKLKPVAELDADSKHYAGEGYFFRAYLYFDLLKKFGALPWVDQPLNSTSEELYSARLPRNQIAQNIVADLDKAISMMKAKGAVDKFRVNKDLAVLLKARICLYEGTWEKYHAGDPFGVSGQNGSDFLNLAKDAASSLMSSGNYSLYNTGDPNTTYFTLFNKYDYSAVSEVMFWADFDFSLDKFHRGQNMWYPSSAESAMNGYGLSKSLVESYLCTDGKPISTSTLYKGDKKLIDEVTNRDPRLDQTVFKPGDILQKFPASTVYFTKPPIDKTGMDKCTSGYKLEKGGNPEWQTIDNDKQRSTVASIIFRYAEALLIYAEAKAELGNLTQTDVDLTINKLRSRVGMPNLNIASIETDPKWDFPNLSPIINEVRRERRVELACEGYRFDDLMRWAAGNIITGKRGKGFFFNQSDFPALKIGTGVYIDQQGYVDVYQKSLPAGYGFNPQRDYLLPVPSNEITLNDKLKQNPGW